MGISKYFDLNKKVIIITGSGRGNGYQIASDFKELGSIVYRLDNKFKKTIKSGFNDIEVDINNHDKVNKIISEIFYKKKKY